jgi:hypothetical protein
MNGINSANRSDNGGDTKEKTAYYAKKGEPMYMAEMDSDEDGIVTLDEFRDYCKSNGIKTNSMLKMSKMAASYRTMQAENEAISNLIPKVHPLKQNNSEPIYSRQGDGRYNLSMDANKDKTVTYKEYMEYCRKNAVPDRMKADAKAEETDNGGLKITNTGKALETYKSHEASALRSTFEEAV